jgi:outer membrane protein assembly factor BamE (lipoprotein component of BamABCDE complex)
MRLIDSQRFSRRHPLARRLLIGAALGVVVTGVSACNSFTTVQRHGYIISQDQLDQVPIGSSKEQVDYVLGTPSTTATFGNEVYYYISQTTETTMFLAPKTTDRRILAVYFDQDRRVERFANYGLEDGRVIDFISRTTPTTGAEASLLKQIFSSAVGEEIE